jgi:hypothetical protein
MFGGEWNYSLSNYKEYAVTEVGTVTLEMHNGTHCTPTRVWYILGLKKNLISMRWLERQDCGLSVQGGVMQLTCKQEIIMKNIWINVGYRVITNLNCGATMGRRKSSHQNQAFNTTTQKLL